MRLLDRRGFTVGQEDTLITGSNSEYSTESLASSIYKYGHFWHEFFLVMLNHLLVIGLWMDDDTILIQRRKFLGVWELVGFIRYLFS